jgi:hypothetical protein
MKDSRAEASSLERRTPARNPTIRSDFTVQLLKAVTVGALGGFLFAMLYLFLGLALRSVVAWLDPSMAELEIPWLKAWGISAVAICLVYFLFYDAIIRETLWIIERVTGHDIDGDQVIGKQEVVHTYVHGAYTSMVDKGQKPVEEDNKAFWSFLVGIKDKGTAERKWAGVGSRYDVWKQWLLDNGYAVVKYPNMRNSAWALKDGVKIEDVYKQYAGWE